ncbi:hypothetical protein P152DRAFT_473405 [Eremomyces bilateralis CBS 781.70]|uniref:Uncharacterized protein n=1 Tax=Eremomyces bilateralis CBS 781.70 TaxID=1392243 RepID=A0A6G1G4B9_9PEZI|nr:uncharacterized protein P152DRAFT_473405 [Eremomyces bilateralis CBS 781.70]KAF1812868.1 hypothetical protein P152DRAFT_473405 [Eremomyces bilateralis CBS 781.70]
MATLKPTPSTTFLLTTFLPAETSTYPSMTLSNEPLLTDVNPLQTAAPTSAMPDPFNETFALTEGASISGGGGDVVEQGGGTGAAEKMDVAWRVPVVAWRVPVVAMVMMVVMGVVFAEL